MTTKQRCDVNKKQERNDGKKVGTKSKLHIMNRSSVCFFGRFTLALAFYRTNCIRIFFFSSKEQEIGIEVFQFKSSNEDYKREKKKHQRNLDNELWAFSKLIFIESVKSITYFILQTTNTLHNRKSVSTKSIQWNKGPVANRKTKIKLT